MNEDLREAKIKICRYCGKPGATDEDYKVIEDDDGEWLCWKDWGGECLDIDEAFERLRGVAVTLSKIGMARPGESSKWDSITEEFI